MTFVGMAAIAVATLVWAAQPGLAVHDNGVFELDGNTTQDAAAPPYDWEGLFDASGGQAVTPGTGRLLGSVFLHDEAKPDPTYFAEVDKDTHDVSAWKCTTRNNPTPKDDLLHAYAAIFRAPNGHKVLYVGSERHSNKGDAFAGFWLLKNPAVGCDGSGGKTSFSGQHTLGDILIVGDYTNGGRQHKVQVYAWDPSAPRNLRLLVDGQKCTDDLANDDACAIANASQITPPWDENVQDLDANEFVEAGVDLTALLETTGASCFTTFQAETRSSQEKTAQLKDFTGEKFNTCQAPPVTTTATPGGTVPPGTPQHDEATVGTVDDQPTPAGTVTFFLCGPGDVTTDGCPSGGAQVGDPVTLDADGHASSIEVNGTTTPNDNAEGKYCWRAEYTPDPEQGAYLASSETNATTECFVVQAPPTHSSSTSHSASGTTGVNTPSHSISGTSQGPVAQTGAGPIRGELIWAAALLTLGGALAYAGRRRGYLRRH